MSKLQLMGGLTPDQIGGARVNRPCTIAGTNYGPGDMLDQETVRTIRLSNLTAMITQRKITPWLAFSERPVVNAGERCVLQQVAPGKYVVIVGRVANDDPMSRAEASQLAERLAEEIAAKEAEEEAKESASGAGAA